MGLSLATANSSYGYEKFTYNGFNQLTAFEDEAGNKATYEYYSDGLRLSKTVNGAKSSYIWTDNNLSMEIKSDEVISYAKAPGYMRTGSSKDSLYRNDKLYLFNGHGDVTSMVDKSGKVTKTYSYDAFGNEVNRDKNDTNPFRYCGEYWDNETESIYLRARYYNPSIGRFTTEDTHWNSTNLIYGDKEYKKDETKYPDVNAIIQSSNLYVYCMSNPIIYEDPKGFYSLKWKAVAMAFDSKGYKLTARLLELSMSDGDNPSFYASDKTYAANLLKQDTDFRNKVNDVIYAQGTKLNKDVVNANGTFSFTTGNGDLGAALHKVSFNVRGSKENGIWKVKVTVFDTFDFTEKVNAFDKAEKSDGITSYIKGVILWAGNNYACDEMKNNVLKPVKVMIQYNDEFK